MLRGPECLDIHWLPLVVGLLRERMEGRCDVGEFLDVEPEEVNHPEEGHNLFEILRFGVFRDGRTEFRIGPCGVAGNDEAAVHDVPLSEVGFVGVELESSLLEPVHDEGDVFLVLLPGFTVDDDVVQVNFAERLEVWRVVVRCSHAVSEDALDEALPYGGGILEAHGEAVELL